MKIIKHICYFIFSILLFSSCFGPTMEEDAKKAAKLSNMSNDFALENKINESERTYRDAQTIITKYKQEGQFVEFYKLYQGFLEVGT